MTGRISVHSNQTSAYMNLFERHLLKVDRISLSRVASCGKAMEIRKFFAAPDLRELSVWNPRGWRAGTSRIYPRWFNRFLNLNSIWSSVCQIRNELMRQA